MDSEHVDGGVKLWLTIRELDALDTCTRYDEIRARLVRLNSDPTHRFTAADAKTVGCDLDEILWVAARKAQHDRRVRDRLMGFVNDCLIEVLPFFEERWWHDRRPRDAINATLVYLAGDLDASEWYPKARAGRDAWAAWAAPEAWVVDGFWATADRRSWGDMPPGDYTRWAEWAAWSVGAALKAKVQAEIDSGGAESEVEEQRQYHQSEITGWALERLVLWLSPVAPDPLFVPDAPTPPAHDPIPRSRHLSGFEMGWSDLIVIPDGVVFLEGVSLSRNAFVSIPESVRHISSLQLEDHPKIALGFGPLLVNEVYLDYNSKVDLPESLSYIDHIRAYSCEDNCLGDFIPAEVRSAEFRYTDVDIPEGLTELSELTVFECQVALPASVRRLGKLYIGGDGGEARLLLRNGLESIEDIMVGPGGELSVPDSVTSCGLIHVRGGGRLILPATGLVTGSVTVDPDAELIRRELGATVGGDTGEGSS